MQSGRFKVFTHCAEWFEEYRDYHRDDGKIVKKRDDLMAATRYAFMMRRYAQPERDLAKRSVIYYGQDDWAHVEIARYDYRHSKQYCAVL